MLTRSVPGCVPISWKDLLRRLQLLQVDWMPLDVAPPPSTRFGSPLVLSRVHWVRCRSYVPDMDGRRAVAAGRL